MKRVLSLMLVVGMVLSLVGCSSSNEPETAVTKLCDALRNFDMETVSSCFESGGAEIQDPYAEEQDFFSTQVIEYLKSCAKKMTYVMGESTIDGENAIVPVTFTYVDASPVISAALGEYISQAFALALGGADDSIMENLFVTIFMEKTESVSTETATSSVEFKCVKTDKGWRIQDLDDDALDEITNIISCNIVEIMESFN